MSTSSGIAIRRLPSVDDAQIEALADVLIDCVDGDASASFMYPLAPARAQAFWRRVAAGVAAGERALLVLDTIPGSDAERLYDRLGWVRVWTIPDYALLPRGGISGTTVFYKAL